MKFTMTTIDLVAWRTVFQIGRFMVQIPLGGGKKFFFGKKHGKFFLGQGD